MKIIKIAFVDFWNCDFINFAPVIVLRKKYKVQIVDNIDDADYVFFSVFGDEHWFIPEDKIKIFYTGENVCPDFNTCDYAIGFEWMEYGDRYFRLPNNYVTPFFAPKTRLMEEKHVLEKGTDYFNRDFCSFVVSNGNGSPIRKQLFEALSKYKKVDSGGRWMNNVGGPVSDKHLFDKSHKFTIACENSQHSGYATEKLVEAFAAQTVPIYWGDPDIAKTFNPKAFVNANDYESIDTLIEQIKFLDNNRVAYMNMLTEPALLNEEEDGYNAKMKKLETFMLNIVEQDLVSAQRHNREFWGKKIILRQKELLDYSKETWMSLFRARAKNYISHKFRKLR